MSFVKSQILDQLADNYPGFLRKDLKKALNVIFDEIIKALIEGNSAQIRGFGSFKVRKLKSRVGRNPKDGSKVEIPTKQSVRWKMSKELFRELNQNTNHDE